MPAWNRLRTAGQPAPDEDFIVVGNRGHADRDDFSIYDPLHTKFLKGN